MYPVKYNLVLMSLIFQLVACSAMGPIYTNAGPPKVGYGLVYIYRSDNLWMGGRDSYFYVNNENIVDLSNNGYTFFYLPEGEYTIVQKWPIDVPDDGFAEKLQIKSGDTVYFRLSPESNYDPNAGMLGLGNGAISWNFTHVSASTGNVEMESTRYQKS